MVNRFDLLGHGLGREVCFVVGSGGLTQPLPQCAVAQQVLQGLGDVLGVIVHQQAVVLVLDHLCNAGQACGDDGHA